MHFSFDFSSLLLLFCEPHPNLESELFLFFAFLLQRMRYAGHVITVLPLFTKIFVFISSTGKVCKAQPKIYDGTFLLK